MTVTELMDELRHYPPHAPVSIARIETLSGGLNAETVFVDVDRLEAGSGSSGYGVILMGDK